MHLRGFPGSSASKESAWNAGDPGLIPGSGRSPWRRDRVPTPVFLGFSGGSAGKGRPGFDPWVGKIPEKGKATQSSILAWRIPWIV